MDVGGLAEGAGLLVGDKLVEVNGKDLSSSSHAAAVTALKELGPLALTVLRPYYPAPAQSSAVATDVCSSWKHAAII